jgi:hypothetical protein
MEAFKFLPCPRPFSKIGNAKEKERNFALMEFRY